MAKEIKYVETKLDGRQPVEWWDEWEFKGRTTEIHSIENGQHTVQVLRIPDNSILCDFCNTDITEFPVPVFRGSYALCPTCYKNLLKES